MPLLSLLIRAMLLVLAAGAAVAKDGPSGWPEGSAMDTGHRYAENRDHFQKLLDKKVVELQTQVVKDVQFPDERLVEAIGAQHKGWVRYRSEECELMGSLTGAGGSWPSTWAVKCEANLTHLRYVAVSRSIRCLRRLPAGTSMSFERAQCLYQLTPLTTGK